MEQCMQEHLSIASEIDELISIVNYGSDRFEDFAKMLDNIDTKLRSANTLTQLEKLEHQFRCAQGSIQTTDSALKEWLDKAQINLSKLQAFEKTSNTLKTEEKIHRLLDLLVRQQKRIAQKLDRLVSLHRIKDNKQKALQPKISRGHNPSLIIEQATEVI